VGDEIQLMGTTSRARVKAVNIAARTLTLDRALAWQAGDGIALAFQGRGPDFGAFEADAPGQQEASNPVRPDVLAPAVPR
jgi:hypothetical protein